MHYYIASNNMHETLLACTRALVSTYLDVLHISEEEGEEGKRTYIATKPKGRIFVISPVTRLCIVCFEPVR